MKFIKGIVCGYLLATVIVPAVKRRFIPAAKHKLIDSITKGIEKLLWGDISTTHRSNYYVPKNRYDYPQDIKKAY